MQMPRSPRASSSRPRPNCVCVRICLVQIPHGVDPMGIIKLAMDKYNVEISGGLGGSAGKVWRVGLMGYNAKPANVELVLAAFRDGLKAQGKLK